MLLAGAALGAALEYLLDPTRGRQRRHLLRDRTGAAVRRGSRRLAQGIRVGGARARGHARGLVYRARRPQEKEPPDDATLAHKVESVLFRDPEVPKGRISINAESGSVFLRGQVDRPELIHELEEAVRRIPDVRDVENLLHLPGTSAPHPQGGRRLR